MRNDYTHHLALALFLLRISVFLVMAMWSLDKLVSPGHAAAVFGNFYGMDLSVAGLMAIGIAQLLVEVAFVLGLWRFWTYGYVVVAHGISTLSSWKQYLDPFENLLFFAAIPMLAAAVALFLLRDQDRLFTVPRG
ncbi:MAG: hypothetical protein WEC99_07110 [Halofilum sp. (in: g-proteobacteria)]